MNYVHESSPASSRQKLPPSMLKPVHDTSNCLPHGANRASNNTGDLANHTLTLGPVTTFSGGLRSKSDPFAEPNLRLPEAGSSRYPQKQAQYQCDQSPGYRCRFLGLHSPIEHEHRPRLHHPSPRRDPVASAVLRPGPPAATIHPYHGRNRVAIVIPDNHNRGGSGKELSVVTRRNERVGESIKAGSRQSNRLKPFNPIKLSNQDS